MNRFLFCAAAVVGSLAAPSAQAQSTNLSKTVYTAVDEVTVHDGQITITGVVQGQSAASSQDFYASLNSSADSAVWTARQQNCLKLATLAMAKPGTFLFSIGYTSSSGYGTLICSLARAVP